MLESILVPLDGSPLAEAALPFASAVAARAGARLILVRTATYRTFFSDVAAEQVSVLIESEDYLDGIALGLRAKGVAVDIRVPLGGSPAEWIVDESVSGHVDLVVMATHVRTGIDRWLRGSVAEAVVHRSMIPVMLVHGTADAQLAQRFETRRPILIVPLDGSDLADSALPVAGDLARATGARVVLLGVIPRSGQLVAGRAGAITTYSVGEHAALEADASAYLKSRAERIADVSDVETIVAYGEAASEISATAEQYAAAAVIMATHGRAGPIRSILGSVAGKVAHGTRIPVVVGRAARSAD
jgi:nucleotide-binding universal stress UspA family protein